MEFARFLNLNWIKIIKIIVYLLLYKCAIPQNDCIFKNCILDIAIDPIYVFFYNLTRSDFFTNWFLQSIHRRNPILYRILFAKYPKICGLHDQPGALGNCANTSEICVIMREFAKCLSKSSNWKSKTKSYHAI